MGFKKGHHSITQFKKGHGMNKGNQNPMWNGGVKYNRGYIMIKKPDHPFRDNKGYIHEHRLIMEKHLGRYLTKDEVVHHINEVKDDNRIENLQLFPNNTEHIKYHHKLGQHYIQLVLKIKQTIRHWENHGISLDLDSDDVVRVLISLLEDDEMAHGVDFGDRYEKEK